MRLGATMSMSPPTSSTTPTSASAAGVAGERLHTIDRFRDETGVNAGDPLRASARRGRHLWELFCQGCFVLCTQGLLSLFLELLK